jgi:hypothetical protein
LTARFVVDVYTKPLLVNRAHRGISYAKEKGKLLPQPCELCGASKTEAHHDDYSRPLAIRWLCKTHHTAVHYPNRKKKQKVEKVKKIPQRRTTIEVDPVHLAAIKIIALDEGLLVKSVSSAFLSFAITRAEEALRLARRRQSNKKGNYEQNNHTSKR